MVDPHQDFYMRIAMRISAYADHPHEPHGSATAWPTLVSTESSWNARPRGIRASVRIASDGQLIPQTPVDSREKREPAGGLALAVL